MSISVNNHLRSNLHFQLNTQRQNIRHNKRDRMFTNTIFNHFSYSAMFVDGIAQTFENQTVKGTSANSLFHRSRMTFAAILPQVIVMPIFGLVYLTHYTIFYMIKVIYYKREINVNSIISAER